ncbi:glutamate synthase subunit beta [Alphaproteobacteria bacterium]|jgi:glutamate synthase (NADPH/NADH) small chain|nr:glutamate synthase subunit beta [Alphaproteobacteria bacterium]|tara:strand:- start:10681 stop:12123 length:1443 start_codon:yes stop_codon:yes gene_type:complete
MGKATGFMEIDRIERDYEPVEDRIKHFKEFMVPLSPEKVSEQGARCMDCGIPYCHQGCPVNNLIPDWNEMVYSGKWRDALDLLHSTNNFPEFTGRICPAPCESSCTLNITDSPVAIKTIECSVVDRGWDEGWIKPQLPSKHTDKKVAVIGSGPSGLACAQQLARAGHAVVVFEKNARIGGLLRIGIPDFKMEKTLIDRRMAQMQSEGVEFRVNSNVGKNVSIENLNKEFDAIAFCGGSETPRNLPVPGRDLKGVYFAMEFLSQQNDRVSGKVVNADIEILAKGKKVLVIGGGDTGSDCVGTSNRQGAISVTQLELLDQPPEKENKALTWPNWPMKLRTSSSHQEGCERNWSVLTKSFEGKNGNVNKLNCVNVEWLKDSDGKMKMVEVEGSIFSFEADLVLLAMGFVHPIHEGLINDLKVNLTPAGNLDANEVKYQTSIKKFFAAGDSRRGQSLVVWAIKEGRQCAHSIDNFLMGSSELPR